MRALGFDDAQQTRGGADGGIDVISSSHRVAAQVKHYAGPVGRPEMQKLTGAAHQFGERLFYAKSGYTAAAREYAQQHDIALFTYDANAFVEAVNDRATELNARMPAEVQLQRIRKREHEIAMADHLRLNPPPSAWAWERFRQYSAVVIRVDAIGQVWSPFSSQLRERYGANSDSLQVWLDDQRASILQAMDEQDSSENALPRDWATELRRLEEIRDRACRLEAQWAIYLDGTTNVETLLNAASSLILEDHPSAHEIVGENFAPGPVDPVATPADWKNVWRVRAAALVRYHGLLAALREIDGKATYNQAWRQLSHETRTLLAQTAQMLDLPADWNGPEHFNVRYKSTATAHRGASVAERRITEFWGTSMKVQKIVDRHANAWAARNRERSDIAPLLASGFRSGPL